ncbi:uncharacterized protein LOC143437124 [Arvicanthis niloticus]|uniref:uncharacterized protein LOC143310290 n=1 Tax=Arvicanthis niloticus TaxID=61156 RepID=UPI00402B363B
MVRAWRVRRGSPPGAELALRVAARLRRRWALVAARLQTEAAPCARARGGRARAPQSATTNQRGPGAAGARAWMLLRLLNATAARAGQPWESCSRDGRAGDEARAQTRIYSKILGDWIRQRYVSMRKSQSLLGIQSAGY